MSDTQMMFCNWCNRARQNTILSDGRFQCIACTRMIVCQQCGKDFRRGCHKETLALEDPNQQLQHCQQCETVFPLEFKHMWFNPTPMGTNDYPLQRTMEHMEDGWALLRVVPVSPYEAIAVFERRV